MSIDNADLPWNHVRDVYDVYGIMHTLLSLRDRPDLSKENLWTVDVSNMIVNLELVAMCDYLKTASIPAEVFSMTPQKKVYVIVLVHNSPTGILQPTEEDIDLTDRLIQVGNMIGIKLSDHLIIKDKNYYSFKNSGLIDQLRLSKKKPFQV